MLTQQTITNALKSVKYPGYTRDIVSFGLVKNIATNNGAVSVELQLTSANAQAAQQIKQDCEVVLKSQPEVKFVHVDVKMPASQPASAAQSPWSQQNKIPGI